MKIDNILRKSLLPSLAVCVALFLFSTCKKNVVQDLYYDYFPIEPGHWVIYDVDSFHHSSFFKTIDTFHFQIKEYIESKFIDNTGKEAERIERYSRKNDTMPWQIQAVWYSNRTGKTAERIEDNQRYIRLVFPPSTSQTWNGNSYNTIGSWDYDYVSIHEPYSLGTLSFDSTVKVEQEGDNNLLKIQRGTEVYAKHVGLVYKHYIHLDLDSGLGNGPDMYMRAVSHN